MASMGRALFNSATFKARSCPWGGTASGSCSLAHIDSLLLGISRVNEGTSFFPGGGVESINESAVGVGLELGAEDNSSLLSEAFVGSSPGLFAVELGIAGGGILLGIISPKRSVSRVSVLADTSLPEIVAQGKESKLNEAKAP